jgi:hypothetical protein
MGAETMAENEQKGILDDLLRSLPLLPLYISCPFSFTFFSFPFLAFLEITFFFFLPFDFYELKPIVSFGIIVSERKII